MMTSSSLKSLKLEALASSTSEEALDESEALASAVSPGVWRTWLRHAADRRRGRTAVLELAATNGEAFQWCGVRGSGGAERDVRRCRGGHGERRSGA